VLIAEVLGGAAVDARPNLAELLRHEGTPALQEPPIVGELQLPNCAWLDIDLNEACVWAFADRDWNAVEDGPNRPRDEGEPEIDGTR
jgi:hypothetical protein